MLKETNFTLYHVYGLKQGKLFGGGGEVNQAYSRLSTTHGHIADCKLDSVVGKLLGLIPQFGNQGKS